ASPRSTSTPLKPSRTAASTPSTAAVSGARSSNSVIAQPSRHGHYQPAASARPSAARRCTTIITHTPPQEPAKPQPCPRPCPPPPLQPRPPPPQPPSPSASPRAPSPHRGTRPPPPPRPLPAGRLGPAQRCTAVHDHHHPHSTPRTSQIPALTPALPRRAGTRG